jgi:hypothetical protein
MPLIMNIKHTFQCILKIRLNGGNALSITVIWDTPDQMILRWDFTGQWGWETFLAAQQQTIDLMNTVPQTVHVIVDVSQSSRLPPGALAQFHNFRRNETPNAGLVVLVGMNSFVKAAATMFLRIFPNDWGTVQFANTVQAARTIVRDSGHSLHGRDQ